MTDLLERLRHAYEGLGAGVPWRFNAPATEQQVQAAESVIGLRLPPFLRGLYLRHNGMVVPPTYEAGGASLFTRTSEWLSLEELKSTWQMHRGIEKNFGDCTTAELQPTDKVRPHEFNPNWIPIGADNGGRTVNLDLDPGPAGTSGQLFLFSTDRGSWHEEPFATSFENYISQLTYCIEHGLVLAKDGYWYDPKNGHDVLTLWDVIPPDWRPGEP